MKILLIEDNKDVARLLSSELRDAFIVEVAYTAKEGEYKAYINTYDLIILDNLLPDMTGIELCKHLRKENNTIPILMLTGVHDTSVIIDALDSGVDDYITKPFSIDILKARIRALLRRPPHIQNKFISLGDLFIDLDKRIVIRGKHTIELRRKELDILIYLARNPNRVMSREMIRNNVWDSNDDTITNTIDVHVKYLRDNVDKPFKKKFIKTIHGFGYKFEI